MPSKQQLSQTKAGFTIIEVVLVLAIAGLIFLMVFVALPALQRSQRDTARRNDMSRVDTSLVQYQTNHSTGSNNLPSGPVSWTGAASFPTSGCNVACQFVRDYMNSGSGGTATDTNEFKDPDGVYYSLAISANVNKDDGSSLSDAAMAPTGWSSKLSTGTNKDNITGLTILDATGADGKKSGNAFDQHAVYIVPGGQCADDVVIQYTARHFAVLYRLEGAGTYCIDDQ